MKPNEWVAIVTGIIGALTGITSLAWNIFLKVSSGPKLAVQAWGNMVLSTSPKGDPYLLSITVQNVGTTSTTLTNLGLHSFKYSEKAVKNLKGKGFNAVANDFYNAKYPFPLKLEVGAEWRGQLEQQGRLDELVMNDSLWIAVYHSFSKQPMVVQVIKGPRS